MREKLAEALKMAVKSQDKRRTATLRLIHAAIHDRDIAHRGAGKDPVSDEEIVQILAKMVKQREESARLYEEGCRVELGASRARRDRNHPRLPAEATGRGRREGSLPACHRRSAQTACATWAAAWRC